MVVPLYAHYLEVGSNGVIQVIFAAFVWLNILYTFGLESTYFKFASGEQRKNAANVFTTATWMLIASCIVFSVVLILVQKPFFDLIELQAKWHHLIYYMVAILVLDTLSALPLGELRLQNRPRQFATVRLLNVFTNLGLNALFIIQFGWGIEGAMFANTLASALTLVLLLPIYFQLFHPTFFYRSLMDAMLKYALPLLPNGLAFAATETLSRIYLMTMEKSRILELYGQYIPPSELAKLVTPEDYSEYVTGIFSNIYKLGVFMMLITQMFRFAWQPFYFNHAKDADAKPLFARVFTAYNALALIAWLAITFFANDIVAFSLPGRGYLIPEKYWFALPIVPIVLLAYFFQGWDYNFTAGIYIEKQTKLLFRGTLVGAFVTFAINMLFVPQYGILAAAFGTLAAYFAMAITIYFIGQKVYPVPYEWTKVLTMCSVAIGLFILWQEVPFLQRWWLEIPLIGLFGASLVWLNIIPKELVQKVLKRR